MTKSGKLDPKLSIRAHARFYTALELCAVALLFALLSARFLHSAETASRQSVVADAVSASPAAAPAPVEGKRADAPAETAEGPELWVRRLYDADPAVREAAGQALVQAGPASVRALVSTYRDVRKRRGMTAMLQKLGPAAVGELIALLKDDDLRSPAGDNLFQLASPAAKAHVPALLACVREPKAANYCGMALVKAVDPKTGEHLKLLTGALADRDAATRTYAALALAQHGAKAAPAVEPLRKALGDASAPVRAAAARALGAVGKKAAAARPELETAARDEDPEVRETAAAALKQVGGDPR